MASFKTRMRHAAADGGRIILANDYPAGTRDLKLKTLKNIQTLHRHVCAIKLNLHMLLPLGRAEISGINAAAHRRGLQVIADIKLNDIADTNSEATKCLWVMGFDAVIANPVMGRDALKRLVIEAHKNEKGVIALCRMSAPEAATSYDIRTGRGTPLHRVFLEWAISQGADGVVAGATIPEVVRYCKRRAGKKLDVYSPGVGTQGGSAVKAVSAGSDYLIVGRTILGASDPVSTAAALALQARK